MIHHAEVRIQMIEPAPHQVFQRDDRDRSVIPLQCDLAEGLSGIVEARVVGISYATPWTSIGSTTTGAFAGGLPDVTVGQFRVEVRLTRDGEVLATGAVEPVFVGDLWILAGQSNMEGCGKLIDVETPQVGVSCYYMGDRWAMAEEPLCWLNESLDPVNWTVPPSEREKAVRDHRRERTQGAGLGIPFAKEMLKFTGVPIGLIMCAHGGTSMEQWDPGLRDQGGQSLYGATIRKVRKLGGRVKGCLWYQGESDANANAAPHYLERMRALINQLRRDVDDPTLPFILAQLSVFYTWEDASWWNRIQQEQLALESELDHVAMVPTIDASMSDAIHLDAPSLRRVGQRMAWAALRFGDGKPAVQSGPRAIATSWGEERRSLRIALSQVNGTLEAVPRAFGFHLQVGDEGWPLTATVESDNSILLTFERPVPSDAACHLYHGRGFNPAVNVKDSCGIPLPVFGPWGV